MAFKNYKIFYKYSLKLNASTIFLIHGYPTSSFDWVKIWDRLSDHYQIIAIDLLGLGFSEKPAHYVYSVQDHADQCIALVKHLKLNNIHLVGHDLGVGIIQELIDRQQQHFLSFKIDSAIFMNGSLFPEVYRPRLIQNVVEIDNCGHWTPWEKPNIVATEIENFLMSFLEHDQFIK